MVKTPRLLLLFLSISLWLSPMAHGQADFFTGKQIKIVVGFSAGGIIDLWARLFALYLGKYIPGNPTLVVQNLPGGGSMIAANQLFNGTLLRPIARRQRS
jgi:tripartite-type tricarboxylate transporter receptor subunit TctC